MLVYLFAEYLLLKIMCRSFVERELVLSLAYSMKPGDTALMICCLKTLSLTSWYPHSPKFYRCWRGILIWLLCSQPDCNVFGGSLPSTETCPSTVYLKCNTVHVEKWHSVYLKP
jgi:hypothetical protein